MQVINIGYSDAYILNNRIKKVGFCPDIIMGKQAYYICYLGYLCIKWCIKQKESYNIFAVTL